MDSGLLLVIDRLDSDIFEEFASREKILEEFASRENNFEELASRENILEAFISLENNDLFAGVLAGAVFGGDEGRDVNDILLERLTDFGVGSIFGVNTGGFVTSERKELILCETNEDSAFDDFEMLGTGGGGDVLPERCVRALIR